MNNKYYSDVLFSHIGHNLYFDLSQAQLNRIYNAIDEIVNNQKINSVPKVKLNKIKK